MDDLKVWKPLGEGSESRIVANPSGTAGEKTVSIRATDCELTVDEARAFAAQILQAADGKREEPPVADGSPDDPNPKNLHVQRRGGLQNRLRIGGLALVVAAIPMYFIGLTLSLFLGGFARQWGFLLALGLQAVGGVLLFSSQSRTVAGHRGEVR